MDPFETWLVGNGTRTEMQVVHEAITAQTSDVLLKDFSNLTEIFQESERGEAPDLGVIIENHPDEWQPAEIEELWRCFPLTRWVCCQSVWCEAAGRTREYWPDSVRVPARDFPVRLEQELRILKGEIEAPPFTAARDETFATHWDFSPTQSEFDGKVVIVSPDREWRLMLAEFVRSIGGSVSDERHPSPSLCLFDVDPLSQPLLQSIRVLRADSPALPIIGLASMAHPERIAELQSAGITSVVSKLLPLRGLASIISQVLKAQEVPES